VSNVGACVGRRAELTRINELRVGVLDAIADGLFVLGEAGVGKARLIDEARADAG
jgi:hypothetical protein